MSVDEVKGEGDMRIPEVWSTQSHYRITRRGRVLKSVSERYLRSDLGLGYYMTAGSNKRGGSDGPQDPLLIESGEQLVSLLCSSDENQDEDQNEEMRLVVCDANVLLHNMDVLEHPSMAICNIVIPQTALMECRKNSLSQYTRCINMLKNPTAGRCLIFFPDEHHIETQLDVDNAKKSISPNDVNDMRLRKVASFFGTHLSDANVNVVFLTDDHRSRTLAFKEQGLDIKTDVPDAEITKDLLYTPQSVRDHVRTLERQNPNLGLSDLVAHFSSSSLHDKSQKSSNQDKTLFSPHVPLAQLLLGVKEGRYYQGIIRCTHRTSYDHCYVTIRRGDERVAVTVQGSQDMNRAVDGDIVAVQLYHVSQWASPQENQQHVQNDKNKSAPVIAMETANPTIRDEDNVQDTVTLPSTSKDENKNSSSSKTATVLTPTGRVVGIVKRNFRQNYCGSIYHRRAISPSNSSNSKNDTVATPLSTKNPPSGRTERDDITDQCEQEHLDGSFTCVFFAVDKRVPPVMVRTSQRDRLVGQRILVAIDSWPHDTPYPLGHFVRTIGEAGDKDVETEVVLHEHNIPCEPFSAKVLACLPPADFQVTLENSPGRLDLRSIPVLSIDPPGCKDIDDALHCTVLPNGNYQVGVHIADVTHYVHAGTPIDVEAANRSTSTYLVNKRLDMLPSLLTTDLCSLKGNVDRFAFSVLWEVTPDADILKVEFHKTIIHSIAALTYQQAQAYIDKPASGEEEVASGAVNRLASLARKFRKRRMEAGALTLASPEVKFVLDSESLNPTDVQAYALLEANAVVEEFMLLANVTVAKKILRHYPTLSILRRHPAPVRSMFDSLIRKAKVRGFDLDVDDSKKLADSLDAARLESDPYFNKLLRILSTRCMSPAQYFCSGEYTPTDWHHYGLAAPVYTHFTSPIRRYADVCVHRLLAAAIGVQPLPVRLSSKSYLHDLAANMNRRHRAAQLAGRSSVQLHTLFFFSGEGGGSKVEDAYVLDVNASPGTVPSLTVIVPRYGIEGQVSLCHLAAEDPRLVREPDLCRIAYKDKDTEQIGDSIQVFDKIRVKIWVQTILDEQKELVVDLIEPAFGKALEAPVDDDSKSATNRQSKRSSSQKDSKKSKRKRTSKNKR